MGKRYLGTICRRQSRPREKSDHKGSLTFCSNTVTGVKLLNQQHLALVLAAQVIPRKIWRVQSVEIRPVDIPPDMISLHQV